MAEARERWASRPAFIMAAVGSAIGLGNVWRFPGVAFQNGGGAFFVPYFIALLTAGIPLMIVEYGIGSRFQGSAPQAYRKLDKRFEWVGWWAVMVGLMISFYYCVILAWSWEYLWASLQGVFNGALPWEPGQAGAFFEGEILRTTDGPGDAGAMQWGLVIGLALTWICIYLSIAKGVHRVGKVVMITVPLPMLLLLLLALRGLTLDGAIDGLSYYLSPDWSRLTEPKIWLAAYGQVFFSLSVGWGILIAYASFRPKGSDVVNNAYITSFANCGFSFLAGFAVFSTLGYLGVALNKPIPDFSITGGALAFSTYPTAIENFPGGVTFQAVVAVGFFVMLLTLGVDSAFSIVEAVSAAMKDKFKASRAKVVTLLCVTGFLMGLIFCFGAGQFWLDITDKFMSDYGLALVALVQCLLIAWILPRDKFDAIQRDANERSELKTGVMWRISLRFITPVVLITTFILSFKDLLADGYGGYEPIWLLIFGALPAALVLVASFLFQAMKGASDED